MSTQTSAYSKIIFFLFLLLLSTNSTNASGELIYSQNGMVVSASEIASEVGIKILKNGGNAVDAAVATGFALAVVYPSAGNIAGGGFMVLHLNEINTTIDFREKAPFASTRNMFLDSLGKYDPQKSLSSWSSVGVPGTVAGFIYVLEKYGTMSLEEVINPAIQLALNGFVLDYWLTNSINFNNKDFAEIESSRKIFTNNGDSLKMNSIFKQADLAKTLTLIKKNGKDGFYDGEIAELIVRQSSENSGIISDDLKAYEPIEREPVVSLYKDFKIIGMPPPSAGGIGIAQILNVFEKFSFDQDEWGSSRYIHTLAEIFKFVYADRAAHLGDHDFYNVPLEQLLSDEHANNIYSKIDSIAIPSLEIHSAVELPQEDTETTHYSVIDKKCNAVSTTFTLNSAYGNKIVVDGGGFLLNNEMDDFSSRIGVENQFGLIGSEANAIEPNKRMLSSMSPTIVLKDDVPILIVGSPGGSTIITSTLQVILNVIEFGMDLREAVNSPRIHHQWWPDEIVYEKFGMSEDVKTNLTALGYNLREISILGRVEAIYYDLVNKLIWGISDKRGFGKAIGY